MRYNSGFVVAFSKIVEIINSCPMYIVVHYIRKPLFYGPLFDINSLIEIFEDI